VLKKNPSGHVSSCALANAHGSSSQFLEFLPSREAKARQKEKKKKKKKKKEEEKRKRNLSTLAENE